MSPTFGNNSLWFGSILFMIFSKFFSRQVQKDRKTSISTTKTEARKILEILTTAMSQTVEIDVTSYIHDDLDQIDQIDQIKRTEQITHASSSLESSASASFATQINLLDGTINHEIDLKLIDNDAYRELQRWHIEQVKQKQDSLITSLQRLEEMRHLVLNSKQQAD